MLGPLSLNEVYMETSSQSGMSNFGGEEVYIDESCGQKYRSQRAS